MPRLIWVFAGCTFILLVLSWGGSHVLVITVSNVFQMVRRAYNILMPVLLSDMTKDILKSAKVDIDGTMYLDDFLGDNDFNWFNRNRTKVGKLPILKFYIIIFIETPWCNATRVNPDKFCCVWSGSALFAHDTVPYFTFVMPLTLNLLNGVNIWPHT